MQRSVWPEPVVERLDTRAALGLTDAAMQATDPQRWSDLRAARACLWLNPGLRPWAEVADKLPLGAGDIAQAAARLDRWAPVLARLFPELAAAQGRVESPLLAVPRLQAALESESGEGASIRTGGLWIKADHALPVAGSIKARGGFHEVLQHAEALARAHGLIGRDDAPERGPAQADPAALQALFAAHRIVVGSTGNLGLSIGLLGSALGFGVTVHMSADARAWKKSLLRAHGVQVVEHTGDYGAAVARGRDEALAAPNAHFVDDERSPALFLGYAVAGRRVAAQLAEAGVRVDAAHPLCVYLPCGVGGGPGGVAFGLKQVFGDAVHVFFAEPVQSPCVLLGLASGLHDRIAVGDIGLSNRTLADGLAVGRASALACRMMAPVLSGVFTVTDERLLQDVARAWSAEGLKLEPSAVAGFGGPAALGRAHEAGRPLEPALARHLAGATHLLWTTGGSRVPEDEWRALLAPPAAPVAGVAPAGWPGPVASSGPDVPHE